MARQLNRLTARTAATRTKPGRHADGQNLYLKIVRTAGGGLSKSWVFMYMFGGKQREAGLGSVLAVTLVQARAKGAECRSLLAKGVDPLEDKKASGEANRARKTFGQCADELIKSKRSGWRSEKHATQWWTTIETYCRPIWDMPVDGITTADVLAVLTPVWAKIPETASRLRGRIEAVLDYAKAHGLRSGENPARWRGHLASILPKRQKFAKAHLAALPYRGVPAFVAKLRERDTVYSLALEFVVLTACRTGEVLGAKWNEIDVESKVWTIPAGRMKAGIEHRIPLSRRALEIVTKMAATRRNEFLFPGFRHGQPIGHATLRRLTPVGATTHGYRSSFRDWCGEETSFPRELAEQALAHTTGNAVEAAYRRGDALEKRRALMDSWSSFCEPRGGGNVISLARKGL